MEISNGVKRFEILEHTADLKIRVFGRTKQELFKNAVLAMMDALRPVTKLDDRPDLLQVVKMGAGDLAMLLVDFLSEVLYLTQVNKEIYEEVEFKKFSNTQIEAELVGKKVESFGEDIKAVTYNGLEVRKKEDGTWEATVLFDI